MLTALTIIILAVLAVFAYNRYMPYSRDTFSRPRGPLYYGYYGDTATQYDEVKDHVNLVWIAAWDRDPKSWVDAQFDRIKQAAEDNKQVVIMMTNYAYLNAKINYPALDELDQLLARLDKAGLIKHVSAIYPVDEPEPQGITTEEILRCNTLIRAQLSKYPGAKDIALAVFYTGAENYVGIAYYDWVGFDEYHVGTRALAAKYGRMVKLLREDQRTMIIPGGCDKWRQDPRPFVDFALKNSRVVALVPFIWLDNADPGNTDVGLGIRSNGLAQIYREAGLSIIFGTVKLPIQG